MSESAVPAEVFLGLGWSISAGGRLVFNPARVAELPPAKAGVRRDAEARADLHAWPWKPGYEPDEGERRAHSNRLRQRAGLPPRSV